MGARPPRHSAPARRFPVSRFGHFASRHLATLAGRLGPVAGWRRAALAAAFGVLATTALPPGNLLLLLPVAFTGLVWLVHASPSPWRAMAAGWWFGFAHFLTSLFWIGPALSSGSPHLGWMVVPAMVGLSAGLALFPALVAFAARLPALPIAGRVLAVAIAWTVSEWLRGNILSGFPINLMGSVWVPSLGMIQGAAFIGVYGLSFVTILAAAAPAVLATPRVEGSSARRFRWFPAVAFGLLAVVWAGGEIRLALAPELAPAGPRLRLVQSNIEQRLKWEEEMREAALDLYVRLSSQSGHEALDLVVWPESAVTFYLDEDPSLREFLSRAAPPDGHLVTGTLRRTRTPGSKTAFWNSLQVLAPEGAVVANYDKHHLVPFGEYNPLRRIFPFPALAYGPQDYSAGPGPRSLRLAGLPPFSPLICYEVIFPGNVIDNDGLGEGETRPEWLLNITNDAWFDGTAGPHQLFQAARLRAVEEGLPLVRVANTGISAVVDAYGRVVGQIAHREVGVLDIPLPGALAALPPQARFGDWILAVMLLLATAALFAQCLQEQSRTGLGAGRFPNPHK